jgi:hypothetical protein
LRILKYRVLVLKTSKGPRSKLLINAPNSHTKKWHQAKADPPLPRCIYTKVAKWFQNEGSKLDNMLLCYMGRRFEDIQLTKIKNLEIQIHPCGDHH